MTSDENSQDENLLWVRFHGPELKAKSVPIYELGQTLVALQTIIHKVYWHTQEPSAKGRIELPRDVRNRLALRIKERQTGSDWYALVPFLSDPYVVSTIGSTVATVIIELGKYVYKQMKRNSRNAPMTSAIYNQVNIIVDRIDNTGGITKIEVSSTSEPKPLVFDKSVQQYVREIRSEPIRGETTQIEGQLTNLDVRFFAGRIWTRPGQVRLHLSPEDFNQIRYQSQGAPTIKVEGRYLYFLGREGGRLEEFEVSKILDIQPE